MLSKREKNRTFCAFFTKQQILIKGSSCKFIKLNNSQNLHNWYPLNPQIGKNNNLRQGEVKNKCQIFIPTKIFLFHSCTPRVTLDFLASLAKLRACHVIYLLDALILFLG